MTARKNWQVIQWSKPGGRSQHQGLWTSLIQNAGIPGAGVLAGTSVAAGVVPTDATAGFPLIDSFNGEAGFIHRLEITGGITNGAQGPYRWAITDLLWKGGAYPFNAAQALAGQPSYASRIPGGTDYKSTEIWVEVVTAFTGVPTFQITYTNDAGTAGKVTTYTPATASVATNAMYQVPLADGDLGVQKIENVTCTIATVGTFNVLVLRPLVRNAVMRDGPLRIFGEAETQLVQVFDDSALFPICVAQQTLNTTNPEILIYVAHGTPAASPNNDFNVEVGMPPTRNTPTGSGDTTAPTIAIVSPTPGVDPGAPGGFPADLATARDTPIIIDVTDAAPGNRYICVIAKYRGGTIEEVVYRRDAFRGPYAAYSSSAVIANGVRLSCRRLGGWPGSNSIDDVTFELDAMDQAGNLAT